MPMTMVTPVLQRTKAREAEVMAMIRDVFRRIAPLLDGYQVFLFGSRASGAARPRSDFDVGIIGEKPIALRDFYVIEDLLENLPTLYTIDWVDFNRASARFRNEAMKQVEILYE